MESVVTKIERRFHDAVNFVLAVLLFVSPWALSFTGETAASWNAWVTGVLVALVAVVAIAGSDEWSEWVTALLGVWTAVAPWILGFSSARDAMATHVALGVLIAAFAARGVWSAHHPRSKATA
jgi:hypothetical protein